MTLNSLLTSFVSELVVQSSTSQIVNNISSSSGYVSLKKGYITLNDTIANQNSVVNGYCLLYLIPLNQVIGFAKLIQTIPVGINHYNYLFEYISDNQIQYPQGAGPQFEFDFQDPVTLANITSGAVVSSIAIFDLFSAGPSQQTNVNNLPLDVNGCIKMDIEDYLGAPVSTSNAIPSNIENLPSIQNVNVQQTGGIVVNTSTGYLNMIIQGPLDVNGNVKMDIEDVMGTAVSSNNLPVSVGNFPSLQNINIQQTGGIPVNTTNGYLSANIENLPAIQSVNIQQTGGIVVDTTNGFVNMNIAGPVDANGYVKMDIEDVLGTVLSLSNPVFTSQTNIPTNQNVNIAQYNSTPVSLTNPFFTSQTNIPAIQNINVKQTGGIAVDTTTGCILQNLIEYNSAIVSSTNPIFTSQTNIPATQNVNLSEYNGTNVSSSNPVFTSQTNIPSLQNINIQQTGGIPVDTITGYLNESIQNFPNPFNMNIDQIGGSALTGSILDVNLAQLTGNSVSNSTPGILDIIIKGPLDTNGSVSVNLQDYNGTIASSTNPIYTSITSGTISQNVTIIGPLDSHGNVKVDLETLSGIVVSGTNPIPVDLQRVATRRVP